MTPETTKVAHILTDCFKAMEMGSPYPLEKCSLYYAGHGIYDRSRVSDMVLVLCPAIDFRISSHIFEARGDGFFRGRCLSSPVHTCQIEERH